MGWKLDRDFFRFLVGLYLLAVGLAFLAMVHELAGPAWSSFSNDFDRLVDQHFGQTSEAELWISFGILISGLTWNVVSAIGLRRFRPWSRPHFWISELVLVIMLFLPRGDPVFLGPLGNLMEGLRVGLFAAVVLLAYSRDHGADWFKSPMETLKETF